MKILETGHEATVEVFDEILVITTKEIAPESIWICITLKIDLKVDVSSSR